MYRRILVATDDTDSALRAVHEAIALAREGAAALRFVHVGDVTSSTEHLLEQIRGIADRAGVASEHAVIRPGRDDVAAVIVAEAKRWRADLIVVGSHGRHGLARLMFGSVSETLAGMADVSVLVVHQVAIGTLVG
jgi:nucleotide-binding universal stress UspA family protein